MAPIKKLQDKIDDIKRSIAGLYDRLIQYKTQLTPELKHSQIQTIYNRVQNIYANFDQLQSEFDSLLPGDIDNSNRFNFETEYNQIESDILNMLNNSETKPAKLDHAAIQVPLPEIKLPIFDGSFLSWINFRDIFQNLIHFNNKIDSTLKFHYLYSSISKGKAFQFIEFLPPTGPNYEMAWNRLFDHYENEVRIKQAHVKEIYDLKKVQENSVSSLHTFIETFFKHYNALKALQINVDSWNLLLIHHLYEKLDFRTRQKIDESSLNKILSIDDFFHILKQRLHTLESYSNNNKTSLQPKPSVYNKFSKSNQLTNQSNSKYVNTLVSTDNYCCSFCNANHSPFRCSNFTQLSIEKRKEMVDNLKLCSNCLAKDHAISQCKSGVCRICYRKHHTLLHVNSYRNHRNNNTSNSNVNNNGNKPSNEFNLQKTGNQQRPTTHDCTSNLVTNQNSTNIQNELPGSSNMHAKIISNHVQQNPTQILLSTAVIWVVSNSGTKFLCRALIDSGSQSNFITENFCQKLNINKEIVNIPVSGLSKNLTNIKHKVNLKIHSRVSDFNTILECLVIPKITGQLSNYQLNFNPICLLDHIQLGDPQFFIPDQIDMLIGAELYCEIVTGKRIQVIDGLPPLQESVFGYILSGRVPQNSNTVSTISVHCSILENLNTSIQKFWQIEEIQNPHVLSIEEKLCENHYSENVRRLPDGRYSVPLPLKSDVDIGQNKNKSLRQYFYQERLRVSDPSLNVQYTNFMNEYLSHHHMEKVVSANSPELSNSYFLPHHAVLKPSSTTTKLRVVFNGSSKTSNNNSLNDILMVGPTIQQDLVSILIRFRTHTIAFIADITKMYRQILIHPEYRHLQRIWWRNNMEEPVSCFQLCTVTYGTASAPFLAIRTLKQLANDERFNFSNVCEILENDFYVDDVVSGTNSPENLKIIQSDLTKLLSKGGFELCKWASNCKEIISDSDNLNAIVSVLGVKWDTVNDMLLPTIGNFKISQTVTKRSILSTIAQIFDPIGLLAPVTLTAKQFMQEIWRLPNTSWDDQLPESIIKKWLTFLQQIVHMVQFELPRSVISTSDPIAIELHGFGDASTTGYGCCIYIKTIDHQRNTNISLLCAKSKIAPLKLQTIPRLELCASLLLAQLYKKVMSSININFSKTAFYTDSSITLHRIKSNTPANYVTFVANRITQIQELTNPNQWYYVPTQHNPADYISRGLMPDQLQSTNTWWQGPEFLYEQNQDINFSSDMIALEDTELKISTQSHITTTTTDMMDKFSNLNKLLRITSICLRFINNTKTKLEDRISGHIQLQEIDRSLKCWIKVVQNSVYNMEIKQLKNQEQLSKTSSILKLNPFLDDENIVRVGGRLSNSSLPLDQKHNILLPGHHHLSLLIANDSHFKNLHCGPQALLYTLRQKFWITNGRNLCRSIVHKCIRCFRVKPTNINQIMGDLPVERITPSRTFTTVGIDFCGPFAIKPSIRSKSTIKTYIALFICFVTKATHLEMVSDLSTDAFLSSLRRFIARRGRPNTIISDNATNFVGAQRQLQELSNFFNSDLLQNKLHYFCLEEAITWKTIPPRSPHFGGLWESTIKIAKHHIRRVMFNHTYTTEEFNTLITQVESCLNSRPLYSMSSNADDYNVLTPGHFLIGGPLNSLPDPSLSHLKANTLSRWQTLQSQLQNFWDRWSKEYLTELQVRNKWCISNPNIKLNQLVLIKDDNLPPMKWMIGRICKLHPGADGKVRVVSIKTPHAEFSRAITKICILPINSEI